MSNLESNKIFAAILLAGIIAMFAGFVADKLIHVEPLEEEAYVIEADEDAASGAIASAGPTGPEPIMGLLASASVERGAKLSRACAACHTFDKGGDNRVGPNLWNIIGAKKAAVDGFAYSDALASMGGTWGYENMNEFLWKPKKYVPGTKMNYIGLRKAEDRAAMVVWLRSLSDNPKPLP